MNKLDIDKAYVSPADEFFYRYDVEHEKSPSQLAEIAKHQRIAYLRDNVEKPHDQEKIWQGF